MDGLIRFNDDRYAYKHMLINTFMNYTTIEYEYQSINIVQYSIELIQSETALNLNEVSWLDENELNSQLKPPI